MESKQTGKRSYTWESVVYPESAPSGWWEELTQKGVPVLCSPLHDADIDDEGKTKKAHYHVLFHFNTLKSLKQVRELLPCAARSEIMHNFKSSVRYLCHLDQPEKAQYDESAVRSCQLDYEACKDYKKAERANARSEKTAVLQEIAVFILEQGICNFAEFMRYCARHNAEWLEFCCANPSSSSFIDRIIRGNYHSKTSPVKSELAQRMEELDIPTPSASAEEASEVEEEAEESANFIENSLTEEIREKLFDYYQLLKTRVADAVRDPQYNCENSDISRAELKQLGLI